MRQPPSPRNHLATIEFPIEFLIDTYSSIPSPVASDRKSLTDPARLQRTGLSKFSQLPKS